MDLDDIQRELEAWRRKAALYEEAMLLVRAEALDFLNFVAIIAPDLEGSAKRSLCYLTMPRGWLSG